MSRVATIGSQNARGRVPKWGTRGTLFYCLLVTLVGLSTAVVRAGSNVGGGAPLAGNASRSRISPAAAPSKPAATRPQPDTRPVVVAPASTPVRSWVWFLTGIIATVGLMGAIQWARNWLTRNRKSETATSATTDEPLKPALSTLLSNLPGMAYRRRNDREWTVEYLSEGCQELTGYRAAELGTGQGASFFDLIHPEDRDGIWEQTQKALQQRQRYWLTYRIAVANGGEKWVWEQGAGVWGANGELFGLEGFITDITDRKRVEGQLAYERDLLTSLLESVPDAIYFKDRESRYVRVSRSTLKAAYSMVVARLQAAQGTAAGTESLPNCPASPEEFAESLIGKTDFELFDENYAAASQADEQEIMRSGQPLIDKVECTAQPGGRVTWALTSKMPWYDRDEKLIGTFGISKDMTFLKEAEVKLEAAHRQLVVASRQAGMAEVATSILHNVGNVLNSVNVSASVIAEKVKNSKAGYLEKIAAMLRQHGEDPAAFLNLDDKGKQLPAYLERLAAYLAQERQALLEEVGSLRSNIEHIKAIVATQQGYAKPAGVAEPVQPSELVEDALRINAGMLQRHQIEVERQQDLHLPTVSVDKHRVLQILVNLIRNATHACDEAKVDRKNVTVQIHDDARRLRISVRDNGVGIARENLTRIFNLGFTTRKDGHGFGLHSGALAAREMGGTLLAESGGLGQGATFTLELPHQPPR